MILIFLARIVGIDTQTLRYESIRTEYKTYIGIGLSSLSQVAPPWLMTENFSKIQDRLKPTWRISVTDPGKRL